MSNTNLDLEGSQSLFFQSGKERSVDFALNFAGNARKFVLRLTGSCGGVSAAEAVGIRNLERAFGGDPQTNVEHLRLPGMKARVKPLVSYHFSGVAVFGGTRMLSIHDGETVIPGITEVFPSIIERCPDTVLLGIVPNFRLIKKTPYGDLLSSEPEKGFFTIIHPELDSVLLLQPTPDRQTPWDDEYQECFRLVRGLQEHDWKSLLVVYGGGNVTRREAELWTYWQERESGKWPVLVISGSGRYADEVAADSEFLKNHPDFHVAHNNVDAIRSKLIELEALVPAAAAARNLKLA